MSTTNPAVPYASQDDPSAEFEESEWSDVDYILQPIQFEMVDHSFLEDYSLQLSLVRSWGGDPGWYEVVPDYAGLAGGGSILAAGAIMAPAAMGVTLGPEVSPLGTEPSTDLRSRLDEVNRHFRRKAASVLNDDAALRLLAVLYSKKVVRTSDFDFCKDGRSLAKLTAAHFCEVGANGVYITDRGQRLIMSLSANE